MKLTSKIIIPVGFVLFLAGASIIAGFFVFMQDELLTNFFVSHSEKAKRSADEFLQKEDFENPQEFVSKSHFNFFLRSLDLAEISHISILDENGQLLAATNQRSDDCRVIEDDIFVLRDVKVDKVTSVENIGTQKSRIFASHDYEMKVPLYLAGQLKGSADIHLSSIFINQSVKRIAYRAAIFFGFFLILVFSTITYLVYYFITAPVGQIVAASTALRQGKWDEPIKISKRSDEIGELADSFERMRRALKKSFLKVKKKQEIAEAAEQKTRLLNENLQQEKDRREGILRYLHSIGEGVIAVGLDGKLNFINQTAAKMVCQDRCDLLIGKKMDKYFRFSIGNGKNALNIDPVKLAEKEDEGYVLDKNCYLTTPLKQLPVAGTFSPIIKDGKLIGVVGVFLDITERRNIEKEKDDFLSIAAHQLRTPLAGIRWVIEMLLDGDAGRLPGEAKDFLKQMLQNNLRLIKLVNELLDVSRINMGKSKEEAIIIDLPDLINDVARTLDGYAKEKQVTIKVHCEGKEPIQVSAGQQHIFQALENLVSNALQYTPSGGTVIISCSVDQTGKRALVSVADNGIGIPEKDKDKVFNKFFRADNAILKESEGSGLGLNVVKSFIEEAGGTVGFQSQEGKGTTFLVNLPKV